MESQPNAGEIVGKILTRFRLTKGWNPEADEDHNHRIVAWVEALGAARVPVDLYDRLYRRAIVARSQRAARGEDVSHWMSPMELIAEYELLKAEEKDAAVATDTPKADCSTRHDAGEDDRLVTYLLGGSREVILPCHECRTRAHEKRKSEQIYTDTPPEFRPPPIPRYVPPVPERKVPPEGALFYVKWAKDSLQNEARKYGLTPEREEAFRILASMYAYLESMGETL